MLNKILVRLQYLGTKDFSLIFATLSNSRFFTK
jgi:hypothetical protein